MLTSFERSNSSNYTLKDKLNWDEYMVFINSLCQSIKESKYNFKYLYGIPRGGAILSHIASHILNIKSLQISEIELFDRPDYKDILIMDDIIDTGNVLKMYIDYGFKTATLFKHSNCKMDVDFFVATNNNWVVFPYEQEMV